MERRGFKVERGDFKKWRGRLERERKRVRDLERACRGGETRVREMARTRREGEKRVRERVRGRREGEEGSEVTEGHSYGRRPARPARAASSEADVPGVLRYHQLNTSGLGDETQMMA